MDSRMTDQALKAQLLLKLCLFTYGPFIGPAVALYFLTLSGAQHGRV
jgi:hypothetical protein